MTQERRSHRRPWANRLFSRPLRALWPNRKEVDDRRLVSQGLKAVDFSFLLLSPPRRWALDSKNEKDGILRLKRRGQGPKNNLLFINLKHPSFSRNQGGLVSRLLSLVSSERSFLFLRPSAGASRKKKRSFPLERPRRSLDKTLDSLLISLTKRNRDFVGLRPAHRRR